jgi:hypothetical protein
MSNYLNKEKQTHDFRTPELEQGDGKFYPLYVEKESFKTVPYETQNNYKVQVAKKGKEDYRFKRSESTSVLRPNNPLVLEIFPEEVITTFRYYLYVYNQATLGTGNSSNKDSIEWSDKDTYQVIDNQVTVKLDRTYTTFSLDQRFIGRNILDQSTINTFSADSKEDPSPGEDKFNTVVSEYKKAFFEMPALLDYAVENENLGDVGEDALPVLEFFDNNKDRFWNSEEATSILPEQFDSECPTSDSVQSVLDDTRDQDFFILND